MSSWGENSQIEWLKWGILGSSEERILRNTPSDNKEQEHFYLWCECYCVQFIHGSWLIFVTQTKKTLATRGKNPGLWLDIAIGIHWSSQSWYISLSDPQGKESWQGVRKLANPQLWGHYNSQHSLLFKWWGAEDPLVACQSLMLTLLVSMCNNTMPFVFRDSVLLHLWILQYGVLEFQAIYWVYRSPLMWYSTIFYRG